MPKKRKKCICNGCEDMGEFELDGMCLDCFEHRLFDGATEEQKEHWVNPHWMDQ